MSKINLWVIICINLVVLECPMLFTKFQHHRTIKSKEEYFLRLLPYMAWWPSWSCDRHRLSKLSFPHPKEDLHVIWLIGQVVSEEKMFKNVDNNKIWVTLDKGQRITLTSGTCVSSYTHSVYNTYQLLHHKLQSLRNSLFGPFPIQKHKEPKLTFA